MPLQDIFTERMGVSINQTPSAFEGSILIIGPLPPPIDGCSLANETLQRNLISAGIRVDTINTGRKIVSGRHGSKFSLQKAIDFLSNYRFLPKILTHDVIYLTPGQTFFGIAKYFPFIFFARTNSIPCVLHIHGNHLGAYFRSTKGIKRAFLSYVIRSVTAGIVLSESLRKNFEGLLPPERVFVAKNFAEDEIFRRFNESKPVDRLHLLYLSNLIREKGILDFIDSLSILEKQGIPFTAKIAGNLESTIEGEVLQKISQFESEVEFVGPVRDRHKFDLLAKSNVFILPTYYPMEGQPISLLEAMASGNIIVTTRHAGIPDIVDTSNGYFIESKSPDSIARCLVEIHSNLSLRIQQMSKYNHLYAASNFTEDRFFADVLKALCFAHRNRGAKF